MTAPTVGAPERPNLVVEVGDIMDEELQWCIEHEGTNKTTIVNRAVQIYAGLQRSLAKAEEDGDPAEIVLLHESGRAARLVIVPLPKQD